MLHEVFRKNRWNKKAIEERERMLLEFATGAWADI
jgi:hypothetical protein